MIVLFDHSKGLCKNKFSESKLMSLNVVFCLTDRPKTPKYSVYDIKPKKKRVNPHIWEAETSKCLCLTNIKSVETTDWFMD